MADPSFRLTFFDLYIVPENIVNSNAANFVNPACRAFTSKK